MKQHRKSLPKTAIRRIYFIDREIASGSYPNASSLAREYETSVSSIHRDIDFMRYTMNAPIKYDFYKKGFYYTQKTFRLPAAYANVDDIMALGMAKNLMELYRNTPIHDAALNLLENISAPLQGNRDAEWFQNRIVVPKTTPVLMDKEVWDRIVGGLRDNRVINFQYQGADAKLKKRKVRPYQLLFDGQAWYLFAYDEDKSKIRMFAVSRISGVTLESRTFTVEKDFDYRKLQGLSYFGIYWGAEMFKFSIAITGDTRWVKERKWADDQEIQETEEGIKLSFSSNQFDKVLNWVLLQGAHARPLAPKALVERWKETVREMAKMVEAL